MHEAVFEAGWDAEGLRPRHREVIAPEYQGRGRAVICLDWTLGHHERGPEIYGVTKSYDSVERRMGRFQTVITAVIANRQVIDGIDLQIHEPSVCEEEETYLKATGQESSAQMEQVRERVLELFHHFFLLCFFGWELLRVTGRMIHNLGEQHSPARRQRSPRPPQMQCRRMPIELQDPVLSLSNAPHKVL